MHLSSLCRLLRPALLASSGCSHPRRLPPSPRRGSPAWSVTTPARRVPRW